MFLGVNVYSIGYDQPKTVILQIQTWQLLKHIILFVNNS